MDRQYDLNKNIAYISRTKRYIDETAMKEHKPRSIRKPMVVSISGVYGWEICFIPSV